MCRRQEVLLCLVFGVLGRSQSRDASLFPLKCGRLCHLLLSVTVAPPLELHRDIFLLKSSTFAGTGGGQNIKPWNVLRSVSLAAVVVILRQVIVMIISLDHLIVVVAVSWLLLV